MVSEAVGRSWPKGMLLLYLWLQPMAVEKAGAEGLELHHARDPVGLFQGKSWSIPLCVLWQTTVLVSMM